MNTIFTILISSVISVVLSSFLTYHFGVKRQQHDTRLKFKAEKYSDLIVYLKAFYNAGPNIDDQDKFLDTYYQSWVYASDETIKATFDMIKIINKRPINQKEAEECLNTLILTIRKDLGVKQEIFKRPLFPISQRESSKGSCFQFFKRKSEIEE